MDFKKLAVKFIEVVKDDLGIPASLRRLIAENPGMRVRVDEPAAVITTSSVVRWHEWSGYIGPGWDGGQNGQVLGWRTTKNHFHSVHVDIPALANLGQFKKIENFHFDISEVTGLSASKSELYRFFSMKEMAEGACREFLQDMTCEGLAQNLRWPEIRIINSNSDFMIQYDWDDGLYLANSGGSHHFAAAQYIAKHLGQSVPIVSYLMRYSLNADVVAELNDEYAVYVIAKNSLSDFHNSMRSFEATHFWKYLPRPYLEHIALLLPRAEARARKVAEVLEAEGFTNLAEILTELASPNAASERRARQDETRRRINALPGLKTEGDVSRLFVKHTAANVSHDLLTRVSWEEVERATIEEALLEHRIDPLKVFEDLSLISPAITSMRSRNTLRAVVDGYAALTNAGRL